MSDPESITVVLENLPSADFLMQSAKVAKSCVDKHMEVLWNGGMVESVIEEERLSSIYHVHLAKNKKKLHVQYVGNHVSVEDMQ